VEMGKENTVYEADVVIVGSGVAGALIAYRLSNAGLKVLVIEAGYRITRGETVQRFRESEDTHPSAAYPQFPGAQYPSLPDANGYVLEKGTDRVNPLYLKAVGGTSWHWGATTLRFLPDEFKLRNKHGVGVDWPISYKELEVYYTQAEQELGVSGESDLGSWRSQSYPQQANIPSWMEQKLYEELNPSGIKLHQRPLARNAVAFNGRPACVGNHNCTPICPTGAQYAAITHIEKAERFGAIVIDSCTATAVNIDAAGLVDEIICKRPDGSTLIAKGKQVIIAANPVETAKLLLLSRTDRTPSGVANHSDTVGRYLMRHHLLVANYTLPEKVYSGRGHHGCMIINQYRNTPDKGRTPGMVFLTSNRVDSQGLAKRLLHDQQLYGRNLLNGLREQYARMARLTCQIEDLPRRENCVLPHPNKRDDLGIPRPLLEYNNSEYMTRGITKAGQHLEHFAKILRAEVSYSDVLNNGSAHLAGTTRMGDDPKESVVDKRCRSHDHKNLYISGASVFPTIGTANPTLTIAAMALRLADNLMDDHYNK